MKTRGYQYIVTCRLPTEMYLTLKAYAEQRNRGVSSIIREALVEYFRSRGFTAADAYAVLLTGSRKEVVMV